MLLVWYCLTQPLTGLQELGLALAIAAFLLWATARLQLATDGHAPAHYRALTVRNLDPWYSAFDVQTGDPLFLSPAERVRVW